MDREENNLCFGSVLNAALHSGSASPLLLIVPRTRLVYPCVNLQEGNLHCIDIFPDLGCIQRLPFPSLMPETCTQPCPHHPSAKRITVESSVSIPISTSGQKHHKELIFCTKSDGTRVHLIKEFDHRIARKVMGSSQEKPVDRRRVVNDHSQVDAITPRFISTNCSCLQAEQIRRWMALICVASISFLTQSIGADLGHTQENTRVQLVPCPHPVLPAAFKGNITRDNCWPFYSSVSGREKHILPVPVIQSGCVWAAQLESCQIGCQTLL